MYNSLVSNKLKLTSAIKKKRTNKKQAAAYKLWKKKILLPLTINLLFINWYETSHDPK